MNDFGPSRGELWFRIVVGILGLCLVAFMVFAKGLPEGPALVEVVGLGVAFFGGTLFFAVRRLLKLPKD
jgi:hypothetical protein